MEEYTVFLVWDDEAGVWYTKSDDIPGLILGSGTIESLIERVKVAVPELLELSGHPPHTVQLRFKMERLAVVA